MEEDIQTNIRKIITTIDNEKKTYSIDVDDLTTFYEFKKILSSAAHLLKNNFQIYHKNQEYTNEYDDMSIKELFPELQTINLSIKTKNDINEIEDELVSIKFNIKIPCEKHTGKYKVLYCFTCNKSICTDCSILTEEHINHIIEEKSHYIAPAKLLINNIFSNANIFKANAKLSKYSESVSFRAELNMNIFENLKKLIKNIEDKFNSCLEFFSVNEDLTEKNTNNNIELLRQYCIEYFIKLKNDIEMKNIVLDDEIFLTVYKKLKEIEKYKNEFLKLNMEKYEKLNALLQPFIEQINNFSNDMKNKFEQILNKDIYGIFINNIQENIVKLVEKEKINDLMFNNLSVQRKSLIRTSIGIASLKNKQGKNSVNSYEKKEFENPFQKNDNNSISKNQNKGMEAIPEISEINNDINNNLNNEKQNNLEQLSLQMENIQKYERKDDLKIKEIKEQNQDLIKEEKIVFQNNNKFIITSTNNNQTNIINNNFQKDISNCNSIENIDPDMNILPLKKINLSSLIKNEISNKNNSLTNKNNESLFKKDALQKNINQTNNNNSFSEKKNAIINLNLNPNIILYYHEGETSEENANNINKQSYQNKSEEKEKISSNLLVNILIPALNKELNETQQELNKNNINNNELKIDIKINKDYSATNINEIKKTAKIENNNNIQSQNIAKTHLNFDSKPLFLCMYPMFNTNNILGAFKDEKTEKFKVDFEQAFNRQDIQLKEFTQGGAYCNSGKYLFISGGQEKQKGIGQIFLRITINESDKKVKMVKMPMMNFSHWNHSMISTDNFIFSLGGYYTNKCELFNLKTLKWEKIADFNCDERQRAILAIYNNYLYAFMGYNRFEILDTVERININNIFMNKWENIKISNKYDLNLKFYGSGVCYHGDKLYFIGGKIGHEDEEKDYKNEIYCFNFENMGFNDSEIAFSGKLNFIENKFHLFDDDNFGNFTCTNNGCLATVNISSLSQ